MKSIEEQRILDQLSGATIASIDCQDEEGMHFYLADGRVLVIVGEFAVGVLKQDTEKFH